ncbi:hypothetical protein OIO90_005143 [Microbotryomycetes sp. JL221]|nr:hypothetical protein OIO90_005143 [Microbotryomycetes sp. JL221]
MSFNDDRHSGSEARATSSVSSAQPLPVASSSTVTLDDINSQSIAQGVPSSTTNGHTQCATDIHPSTSRSSRKRSRQPPTSNSVLDLTTTSNSERNRTALGGNNSIVLTEPTATATSSRSTNNTVTGLNSQQHPRDDDDDDDDELQIMPPSQRSTTTTTDSPTRRNSEPRSLRRQSSSPLPDWAIGPRTRNLTSTSSGQVGSSSTLDKGKGKTTTSKSIELDSLSQNDTANSQNGLNVGKNVTDDEQVEQSLSTLQCPICLGSPTPLVLTSCGHCFCGPCLHAALAAGPPLTPPPPDFGLRGNTAGRGGGGGRGARGGGGGGIMGPAAEALFNRAGQRRNPRRAAATATNNVGDGRAFHEGFVEDHHADATTAANWNEEDDEPPTELDKHCPVCRARLKGGWGRSLRGLYLRVMPKQAAKSSSSTAAATAESGSRVNSTS